MGNGNKFDQQSQLTVYKASAGSGKTFRLAVEYIKLLIENPTAYKNTLAVTFTNKATEEMKMRILGQLYGISRHLPDSRPYLEKIMEETGATEEHIAQQAHTALSYLVHNYNYFRVETIDSFFQSILRNLARELELTANLRISINDKQLEQFAVDNLIESLDRSSKELKWIMSYIKNNIAEDKTWNVIGQIKKFGENIFKDNYKKHGDSLRNTLQQKGFFKSYTDRLQSIREDSQQIINDRAEEFFNILESHGLSVDDFSNGSKGVCSYFLKLKRGEYSEEALLTARVVDAIGNPDKWVKKSDITQHSPAYALASETLAEFLRETEEIRKKEYRLFKSADTTLKHMHQLRLLNSIDRHVHEMNKDANRFMLSDTQHLLQSLIGDSDSPFIYEKIGTQLKNIMVDEFQDTSIVQWENFKILLKECLANEDSRNLIVGDVKQSIYRWRAGDWKLLNNIEQQFSEEQLNVKTLDTNYRSTARVIDFNNMFFKEAVRQEHKSLEEDGANDAEQVRKAYADVRQFIPEDKAKHGYVSIKLFGIDDYQEKMMQTLCDTVKELLDKGTRPGSIAILVRSNRTIQAIADHFMLNMPEVRMVSDEAFRLDYSVAVNMIIDAIRVLVHPEDNLTTATLAQAYMLHIKQKEAGNKQSTLSTLLSPHSCLPHDFTDNIEQLASMPVHNLIERLYSIFHLDNLSDQNAYVCAFFDKVDAFLQEHPADLFDLLEEWDENMREQSIHSDEIDGIRLLTIHKSKGLEFDTVIIPSCDWQLEKSTLLWCSTHNAQPFNELPIVPVDFSAKQMKGTIYEPDYMHEHLQNVVDNLNLLYVAFTRAKNNLFVFGKRGTSNTRSYIIEKVIGNISADMEGSAVNGIGTDRKSDISFEFGELYIPEKETKATTNNVFLIPDEPCNANIKAHKPKAEFRQSNRSRDFMRGEADDEDSRKQYITTGSVMHNLLSNIRTLDDLPAAISVLEQDGVLYDEKISREKLKKLLTERFQNPIVKDWFSSSWKVKNECSIVTHDTETGQAVEHRPDRVMTRGDEVVVVDYKFGSPKPEYRQQVMRYMSLLRHMGHTNVKGFLWYVYSNRIEEVN